MTPDLIEQSVLRQQRAGMTDERAENPKGVGASAIALSLRSRTRIRLVEFELAEAHV